MCVVLQFNAVGVRYSWSLVYTYIKAAAKVDVFSFHHLLNDKFLAKRGAVITFETRTKNGTCSFSVMWLQIMLKYSFFNSISLNYTSTFDDKDQMLKDDPSGTMLGAYVYIFLPVRFSLVYVALGVYPLVLLFLHNKSVGPSE